MGEDDWNIIGDEVVYQTSVVDDFGVLDFKPEIEIEHFQRPGDSFIPMGLGMLGEDS